MASSLVVRDAVSDVLHIAAVSPSTCTVRRQVVTCAFGDLAAGASAVAMVRVRATAPGRYVNHATADALPRDPAPPNNTATATPGVTGTDVRDLLGTGLLLLAAGGWVLLAARRRVTRPLVDRSVLGG